MGDLITLSGQVGIDNEGSIVGIGDIGEQLKQAYINLKEVLGAVSRSATTPNERVGPAN